MIGCSMPKDGTTWLTARNKAAEQELRELTAEAERRMVFGGYTETLQAALWAASQGEKIVPVLVELLNKRREYRENERGATGAYPINVLWALANVDSLINLILLENYYSSSGDKDAQLAIAGCKFRRSTGNSAAGVLMLDSADLYSEARRTSTVLGPLSRGQHLIVLTRGVENLGELDEHGKVQVYDYVELKPSGGKGYLARKDGGFCPCI